MIYHLCHNCHNLDFAQVGYLECPRLLKKWIYVAVIYFIVDCSHCSFVNAVLFLAFLHATIPSVDYLRMKYNVCKLSLEREHFYLFNNEKGLWNNVSITVTHPKLFHGIYRGGTLLQTSFNLSIFRFVC